MPMVNARKKEVLDYFYGNTAPSIPATYYVGLSTTTPTSTGANFTEPGGSNYARVAVTNNTTNFPASTAANPTNKSNGTEIAFPTPSGSWGTPTHFGLFTAASGGTPVDWGAITSPQAISSGATVRFPVGTLVLRMQDV